MLSCLPENVLNATIHKSLDSLQKAINRYRSGCLTEDECRNTCKELLYKVIMDENNGQISRSFKGTLPEDMITPDIHAGHFPTDLVIGWNIWSDDKATIEEALQNQTTAILTDHHGLKTYIKLIQCPKPDASPVQAKSYTEYIGTGTIEGYTSNRPREITITINEDGKIQCLFTRQDCDDRKAFQEYPLWEKYHKKVQELEQKEEEIITKLMQM